MRVMRDYESEGSGGSGMQFCTSQTGKPYHVLSCKEILTVCGSWVNFWVGNFALVQPVFIPLTFVTFEKKRVFKLNQSITLVEKNNLQLFFTLPYHKFD